MSLRNNTLRCNSPVFLNQISFKVCKLPGRRPIFNCQKERLIEISTKGVVRLKNLFLLLSRSAERGQWEAKPKTKLQTSLCSFEQQVVDVRKIQFSSFSISISVENMSYCDIVRHENLLRYRKNLKTHSGF